MSNVHHTQLEPFIDLGGVNGKLEISEDGPLVRLNYFDGKFLRASDLQLEQRYLRTLVEQSNQAGGSGVVHGYSVGLGAGDTLAVGSGLAIDPLGRVLLLPHEATINIAQLIEATRQWYYRRKKLSKSGQFGDCELDLKPTLLQPLRRGEVYVISIAHAETLCGEESVYGKVCEQACVTDTARPYWVEGIVVRARVLQLETPLPKSGAVPLSTATHLRSRIASAYFADEASRVDHFISGDGLRSGIWCEGAQPEGGLDVPIAVIARRGTTTLFLDPWIVRRERMEAPARRYWAWRMRMRPWDVFLAQVLQFQCQLSRLIRNDTPVIDYDPCASERLVLKKAARSLKALKVEIGDVAMSPMMNAIRSAGVSASAEITGHLQTLIAFGDEFTKMIRKPRFRASRILINGGIVELPPAGYLPVDPKNTRGIEDQVQRLMGEGVDLRFCVVRSDYVAHALEEAQHMDRISLLQGLDRPKDKPKVDILVPDGEIERQEVPQPLYGFKIAMKGFGARIPEAKDSFFPALPALTIGDYNNVVVRPMGTRRDELEEGDDAAEGDNHEGSRRAFTLIEIDPVLLMIMLMFKSGSRFTCGGRGEPLRTGGAAFYLAGTGGKLDRIDVRRMDGMLRNMTGRSAFTVPGSDLDLDNADLTTANMSVWSRIRCEHDPFKLARDGSTNVELDMILRTTTTAGSVIMDVRLSGTSTVSQPAVRSNDITRADVTIDAPGTIRVTKPDGTSTSSPAALRKNAILEKYEKDGQSGIKIRLQLGASLEFVFLLAYPGIFEPESEAELFVGTSNKEAGREYFGGAGIDSDQSLFVETSKLHVITAAGVDQIGSRIPYDADFAEREKKRLFDPDPIVPPRIVLRARRDWVLFHRRRDKNCGETAVVVVPEVPKPKPPRKYAVWAFNASEGDQEEMIAAIRNGTFRATRTLLPKFVGDVDFSSGAAQLTPASKQAFPALWQASGPGKMLAYALMGTSAVNADSTSFSRQRLDEVIKLLDPPTFAHPSIPVETVDRALIDLPSTGKDGAIAFLTMGDPINVQPQPEPQPQPQPINLGTLFIVAAVPDSADKVKSTIEATRDVAPTMVNDLRTLAPDRVGVRLSATAEPDQVVMDQVRTIWPTTMGTPQEVILVARDKDIAKFKATAKPLLTKLGNPPLTTAGRDDAITQVFDPFLFLVK